MPRVGSAGTVGAAIRESRRNKKSISQGEEGNRGSIGRSNAGRASKRLSSLQLDDSSRPSSRPSSRRPSAQLASDSPDLPEYLLAAGAVGGAVGGVSGVLDTARMGITPDLRAFPPPSVATTTAPHSATTPSLALSPPTPKEGSVAPNGSDGAATPATSTNDVTPDGASSATPTQASVDGRAGGESVEGADDADVADEKRVEIVVDMSATGDWNGYSTLEKPRDTDYDRPVKGWKTSLAKIFGFFLFFGINGFLIAYLVPMIFKAMLGL